MLAQVVVGKKLDDVFMVMEFMEHDLKGLMEERDSSNPLFAMSEVGAQRTDMPAFVICDLEVCQLQGVQSRLDA